MRFANCKKTRRTYHSHLHSIESIPNKLANSGQQISGNTFDADITEPVKGKPLSAFFTSRLFDHGELPWFEIRALASIGAGLLMRHLDEPKAINKLARLSQPFDGFRKNETAKAMAMLQEDAAGGPYSPSEQDWEDLLKLSGLSLD